MIQSAKRTGIKTRSRAALSVGAMSRPDTSIEANGNIRDIFANIKRTLTDEKTIKDAKVLEWDPIMEEGRSIMSVTWRPIHRWTYTMPLAIFISYVPHITGLLLFLRVIFYKDLLSVEGVILLTGVAVLNDIGIKRLFRHPRPITSRAHGYGMPSSHCASSYAVWIWILYETWLGPPAVLNDIGVTEDLETYTRDRFLLTLFGSLLLIPMAWARVITGDHTKGQVLSGMLLGIVFGIFYVFCVLEGSENFILTRNWYSYYLKDDIPTPQNSTN